MVGKQARNPFREYGRLREDDTREVLPLEPEIVARYLDAAKQYNEMAWRQMMFLFTAPYWSWLQHQMLYMGKRYGLPHAHPRPALDTS